MGNIAVLGAGYVGLTTAVCLSSLGHSVVVSDTNIEKITLLENSICPIFEEMLDKLLVESISSRDFPMVQSGTLFVGAVFVLFNLLGDLAVGWLDPRTKQGRAGGEK